MVARLLFVLLGTMSLGAWALPPGAAKPPDPHHAGSDHVPQPAPAEELPAVECRWRPVRPLPNPDEPFEVVWRGYLADRNVH